jgi:hypothetical protein
LAAVLQKPNYHEMLYMLQRTSLLERRKRKRNDLDKHVATFRSKVDVDLKQANKKSDSDYVDLEKLSVEEAKLKFDFAILLPELQSLVKDYVALNNEYVQVKAAEERLKTKRVKDPKPAPETLEVNGELEKSVDTIVQQLPEHFRPRVKAIILVALGLRQPAMPAKGNLWHRVMTFVDAQKR